MIKWNTEKTKSFLQEKYGDRYDYSKVEYKSYHDKVTLICPKHGEFTILFNNIIGGRCSCKKCNIENTKLRFSSNTEEFIRRAKEIHGGKYDYSKVNYIKSNDKVCIICPKHGEFWVTPNHHLHNRGCPKCSKLVKDTASFIELSKEIHGDRYDYSKVEYENAHKKVCIICPEHGEFWQLPTNHINKKRPQGCPLCHKSRLEEEIQVLLKNKNIDFEFNKYYDKLNNLQLDFFIPSKNIAIECQGEQHFRPVKHFGGEKVYRETIERDKIKNELCKKNNIKLLYYSNFNLPYFDTVYNSKEKLLSLIT